MRAVQEMDRIDALARSRGQAFENAAPVNEPQAVSTSATWTSIGPQPTLCSSDYCAHVGVNQAVPEYLNSSGRITAIAVDPTNAAVVYAGGAMGGVWKTSDGGKTWKPLTDGQASLAVGSIAIDPHNHNTIYVGTGEANNAGDNYFGAGILKSTNGGAAWTNIPGPFVQPQAQHIGAIAVSPGSSNTVIAGADAGIYVSSDAGKTWKNAGLSEGAGTAVVFDPSNPSTVYAAVGDLCGLTCGIRGNGVYKSTNGGSTWTLLAGSGTAAFPKAGVGRIALAIAPSTPSTLYAAIQDTRSLLSANPTAPLLGVWKTTDGGNTWNRMGTPPPDMSTFNPFCGFDGQCEYDLVVQVHPKNPNVVLVGGVTVALSTDGQTFQALPLESSPNGNYGYAVHVDQHAIEFSSDASTVYFGNDGGMWSAPADGLLSGAMNFTNLNQHLSLAQFYAGVSIFPSSSAHSLLGGTQDNGTQLQSGSNWNNVSYGDGGYTAIDITFPALYYGVFPSAGAPFNVWFSFDLPNQAPFINPSDFGINPKDNREFTPPLTTDPVTPSTMYFGTYRVYQSKNGGGLWRPISPDLTAGSGSDDVTIIAISPADSNVVYAGTSNGKVQLTSNALSASPSWTDRTPNLPNRFVTGIAPDALDPLTAYACLSGIPAQEDLPGHIFKTTDGGKTWTDISGNLPNTPVNWIVAEPDAPDTIYAATDVGVQVTTNGGKTWSTLGHGLPRAAAVSLTLNRQKRILYAGTHGRGMWSIALPLGSSSLEPVITSLTPSSVNAGSAAFTLSVTGSNFAAATTVLWNGTSIPTTVVDSQHLTAKVPASDVTTGGRASVAAFNSTGGASAPANFNIGAAPTAPTGGIVSVVGNIKGIAPGMIAALYGTGLAGAPATAPSAPLPTALGQTRVIEDGEALPLIFASSGQIDFQVPWFQIPGTPTIFQVLNGTQVSAQSDYTVVPFAPAIFTVNEAGTGQGTILIANTGTLAAPAGAIPHATSRPAKRGETVSIFATGLGLVDAALSGLIFDGDPAPSNPLAKTLVTPSVSFGGIAGQVRFSGLAPGFVGLNQLNVKVPANAPTGNAINVQITMIDTTVTPPQSYPSNTVTMAIQ